MKHIIFPFVMMLAVGQWSLAQDVVSLPEGEPLLVYSLPKTELCIEVDVEKTTETPGVFYQYSGRYLAEKDVVTAEKTNFRLKEVRVKTRAKSDPARTFTLVSNKNYPLNHIAVNRRGILRGINVPQPPAATPKVGGNFKAQPKEIVSEPAKPLPLTEEDMLASSTSKMAEGAAKQIYRIRESRLSLLTADVDQLPADGASFQTMLAGMDAMERELTELFTGTTVSETKTHTIYLTPSAPMKNEVLFRISALKGLVSAEDLSGSPYYINVAPETIETYRQSEVPAKKNALPRPELYSILPAVTQVSIGDGKTVFYSEQLSIPQFGQLIPIPEELLLDKTVSITLDEYTGRLMNISAPHDIK